MTCFEVSINGKRLCIAGIGKYGVLTTILSWAQRKPDHVHATAEENPEGRIDFHVGGLRDRIHFDWLTEDDIVEIGDEVSIKVIEADSPDEPRKREDAGDPEIARRHRYELYQIYKREFETYDQQGQPIEPIDPEEAKALRRMLCEEYKQEFERDE